MAGVFEFFASDLVGPHRFVGSDPFQSLNACHLVRADRMRSLLFVKFGGIAVRLADCVHGLLKHLRIFLFGVQPHLATMRLKCRLAQEMSDAGDGNLFHNASPDHFVPQFALCPMRDRTVGESRIFAGHSQNLSDLFGRENSRSSRTVSIPQRLAHRFAKLARFGAFQQRQRVPGRLPSPPPQPDLLAFESRFAGNLLIQASLKSQQNDLRPL
ncbi:MAG: hypothetical protein IH897_09975 [Planctomycetes bacterium]|nr:hypothetical protein [Planctomycetota bacterium]